MQQKKSFNLTNIDETQKLAVTISSKLVQGDIITLIGDLGAGKTAFCKFIIQALCGGNTHVTSPSFNLLQLYYAPQFTIYHFDLYRLKHPNEVYDLAIEDAWRDGVCLIEWPEIINDIIPKDRIDIELLFNEHEGQRNCIISSNKLDRLDRFFKWI